MPATSLAPTSTPKAVRNTPEPRIQNGLRIGTWNCGYPAENNGFSYDCIKYCKDSACDIVALQETNYQLSPHSKNDYDLHAKAKNESRLSVSLSLKGKDSNRGLAFLVKKNARITVLEHSQPHQRLAVLKFAYNGVEVMLLNVYAVTIDLNDRSKEDAQAFFRYVHHFIMKNRTNELLIVCGDFNAFPQSAFSGIYEPHIMRHVHGSSNEHGNVFVEFLKNAKLFHLNSRFEKARDRKWTRSGKKGQGDTEVDGFLCDLTDIVQDVDVFSGGQNPSDHRLVTSLWTISKKHHIQSSSVNSSGKTLLKVTGGKKWKESLSDVYNQIWSYIYGLEYKKMRPHEFQARRSEKDMEIMLTLRILLHTTKPHMLFTKFNKPLAETSEIQNTFKKLSPKLVETLSTLMTRMKQGDESASAILLEYAMKSIFDECDGEYDSNPLSKIGIPQGNRYVRRIQWRDRVVFFDIDAKNLHNHAEYIWQIGDRYGLSLDTGSMVFVEKPFSKDVKFTFRGTTIPPSKKPNIMYNNWILAAAGEDGTRLEIEKRAKRASEEIKRKLNQDLENTKRKRQQELQKIRSLVDESKMDELSELLNGIRTLKECDTDVNVDNEKFFKESIIPVFFENCHVWRLIGNNMDLINKTVKGVLEKLSIPTFIFNPRWYILKEQASFLSKLSKKKDSECWKTLNDSWKASNVKDRWYYELVEVFEGFKKASDKDVLLHYLGEEPTWKRFVEYCEQRVYL